LSSPPIPPPDAGKCVISKASGREICYPRYEDLDTTCTDVTGRSSSGLVAPPVIPHATVRAMAFVPPDNLRRLIVQYYRQQGKLMPKNVTFSPKSFLFVKYHCDFGYEMVDEIDTLFCHQKSWVNTLPMCRGKGQCAVNNGGCSHSCLSINDVTVECRCPRGMTLDSDQKTCIKPIPKTLCRSLAGCSCTAIDPNQYSCTCPKGAKCLLLKGAPKLYVEPPGPYEVPPGGNINITCSAVAYPFPDIFWQRWVMMKDPGTVKNEQILIIKELFKNAEFTCHANNSEGKVDRTIKIIITGPGSAPVLRGALSGRTNIQVRWDPPHVINRPITSYTVYYTNNGNQPIKNWQRMEVKEPNHSATIENLRPNTPYFIRLRANDQMGPGRLGNPASVTTLKPAARPLVFIEQGEELLVGPLKPFELGCNITRADPVPIVTWQHKGRPLNNGERTMFMKMHIGGIIENTVFACVAENEAGKSTKRINITVTGPTAPERIRYQVDGDKVNLQWEQPRIINAPMAGYDILYTDNPNLPEDQWQIERIDDPLAHTATITGLKERTPYTFRIRGRNKLGEGLPSGPFNATTWLGARPPHVTVTPRGKIVKEPSNEPLTIECEAIGVPKPKIIWLWSGQLVEDGKDEFRVYDITPMDAQDRSTSKLIAQSTTRTGVATCQAVNAEGSDEKRTEVKILGPGSAPLNIQPTPMHTGFDVAWQPPKRPNGRIKNYIVYYTKDPDQPLSEWKSETVGGDIRNLTVRVDDEDTPYVVKVQAATDDGPGIISEAYEVTTGRKQIPLTVRLEISDPHVSESDTETEVEPAQPIHFRCVAEGRPMPSVSYSWLPMNSTESGDEPVPIPIQPDPAQEHRYYSIQVYSTTSTKRTLLCQARNPDGTVEDKHFFIVNKPGSPPRDVNSYNVYLTGDPSQPVDQWQRFEVTDPNNPKLIFERGELEPESPYYVRIAAVNPFGEGVHSDASHFTTVSGAPIDSPSDILPTVSDDNTVNISWFGPKEPNGPIKSYTIYFAPDDGTAEDDDYKNWPRIEVPTSDDHGNVIIDKDQYDIKPNTPYKVRISATNDQSEGPASEPIHFETGSGEMPPTITLDPPKNIVSVEPEGSVNIICTATGLPQPIVYWVLENGEKIEGRALQLTNLIKDTTATCRAENRAGMTQEVVQVQVSGPGTPPNEIVLLPMPNQVINVEWTTPDEVNGRITNYIVHYGEVPEGSEWKQATVDAIDVNHQLPNLDPKKNYAVRVQAVSDRGPGVISAPQMIRTLPLAPAKIVNPEVTVFNNNSIVIDFVPPADPDSPNKQIKDFVIQYTSEDPPTDETEWKELRFTDPDVTDNYTVVPIDGENFNPDTKYHMRIIPRGEIDGPSSDLTTFTTGDGVITPSQPEFNVDAPDNVIRVPAGTDYVVTCTSTGFPPPEIRWVDSEGNQLSDGPQLKLIDVRRTVKAKCLAENRGGLKETDFTVFVAGPGSAPENVQLHADKPVTISVQWDPPLIPNGNITKYIIYYTPLDDQDPAHQIGQVQSRPINEWVTYHDTPDTNGTRKAELKDFVETDTAYAVVVQAINDDGPGPYSNQYTIRTMSRAREGPPIDLRVDPDGQRSAIIEWKEPVTTDVKPLGYEIYYVPGDKSVDADDLVLSDWWVIVIDDPSKLSHKIQNLLQPDTDYVFKIRAIYPDGPSVFSEPCIMKTLPDGNAPYIQISTGENGVEGSSNIDVLPGSQITVSCNATGLPLPSVKWIRGGTYEIDPSTVDTAVSHAQFSLQVANITEDTTFNCVAQNPLGHANWTINVNLLPGLEPEWKDDFVVSKTENGEVVLAFSDNLPDYLKPPSDWVIRYTDDPDLPKDEWKTIPSDSGPLTRIAVPDMEPGTYYYLVVDSPDKGIQTPTLLVMTPKPPSEIRVGTNINDEAVVDFKDAITSQPIRKYSIKVWKVDDPSNIKHYETSPDVSSGVVLDGLERDTEYAVQVAAEFYEGDSLASEPVTVRIPPGGVACDCAHACTFEEQEDGTVTSKCYCHSGFVLGSDQKSCEPSSDAPTAYTIVRVTPPAFTTEVQPEEISSTGISASPLPTGVDGKTLEVEEIRSTIRPTDSSGRELPLVVGPDGVPLSVNADGELVDNNKSPIIIEDGEPRDPFGNALPRNKDGAWIYPLIDKSGKPLPVDENNMPKISVVMGDGTEVQMDEDGNFVGADGRVIPTDVIGRPLDEHGEPYEINEEGQFVIESIETEPVIEGEDMPSVPLLTVDGEPLTLDDSGHFVDSTGAIIPTNEEGIPVDENGNPLPKNKYGEYVLTTRKEMGTISYPTDESGNIMYPIKKPDGSLLPTDSTGNYITEDGVVVERNEEGRPVGPDGEVLPTDDAGNYIYPAFGPDGIPLPTDEHKRPIHPVFGPDGSPLPTDDSGHPLAKDGRPIPTDRSGVPLGKGGKPLPTDSSGHYVTVPREEAASKEMPTDESGNVIYPVTKPDGSPLPTDASGNFVT
uniref:Fibronectin type-III domain-containing protein n=1 Tax=Haemonchus placei TaxID=6290 RepID=A0A158QMD6_HAEPC